MKILLDNDNASIANVVNICCERINAEVLPYSNDISEFDLIIKNCDESCDISEFDKNKTLFLVPKSIINAFNSYKYLQKPFLPIDLINFLTNFGSFSSNSNSDEIQNSDDTFSEAMGEKIAQDIQTISKIVKEIDDMPTQNQEKIQTGGVSMPSNDKIDILDDDRPLDEILKELSQKAKDSQTINIVETKNQTTQTSENSAPSVIPLDENFKLDDDIPLDQFIQNMKNQDTENSDNTQNLQSVSNTQNAENPQNSQPGDNKISIDENFELDDDIPLDQFIQNMQKNEAPSEQSSGQEEFNQILNSIDKDDFAKDENGQNLATVDNVTQENKQNLSNIENSENSVAVTENNENLANNDSVEQENRQEQTSQEQDKEQDVVVATQEQNLGSEEKNQIEQADDDDLAPLELNDDIDLAPLNLVENDNTNLFDDDELPPLEMPSDDDFAPLNLENETKDEINFDDDELPPLEIPNIDDFAPSSLADDTKYEKAENISSDEVAPLKILNDDDNKINLVDEPQDEAPIQLISNDEVALEIPIIKDNPKQSIEIKKDEEPKDFSGVKLVEVGKFEDNDLQKSTEEKLQEKVEVVEEKQNNENSQENQSEKEQILAQNDEEMSVDELKEKLEETFKKAFETSVASDEKLARALRNLKLDLNIAFKENS